MEFKIEIKGDYCEDMDEFSKIVHLRDILSAHRLVREEIRISLKHDENLDEKTYKFLENLSEMLYVE